MLLGVVLVPGVAGAVKPGTGRPNQFSYFCNSVSQILHRSLEFILYSRAVYLGQQRAVCNENIAAEDPIQPLPSKSGSKLLALD